MTVGFRFVFRNGIAIVPMAGLVFVYEVFCNKMLCGLYI